MSESNEKLAFWVEFQVSPTAEMLRLRFASPKMARAFAEWLRPDFYHVNVAARPVSAKNFVGTSDQIATAAQELARYLRNVDGDWYEN
jgi:hypothetical protein